MANTKLRVVGWSTGIVDGAARIVLDHVTLTHPDQMPDCPQPAPGSAGAYRVEIEGEPMMRMDLSHTGENGDHNISGMVMTAMRLVNAVPALCQAPPGLVFAGDLPQITGRGLVNPS